MPEKPDKPAKKVELLSSEILKQGFFRYDLHTIRHEKYQGGWTAELPREVFECGDAVCVLPYDPIRDEVLLIEEFRIIPYIRGEGAWLISVIAGLIEEGESLEEVARRESLEEAGIEIEDMEYMLRFHVSPGAVNQCITLFCTIVDTANAGGYHGLDNEHEDIKVVVLTYADAMAALDRGDITASPAVIALQWLALNRDRLREA